MRELIKGILMLAVIAPFIFILEAFIYGAPQTVIQNTKGVQQACLDNGGTRNFCGCVAKEFEASLDTNTIVWRRVTFVRDTIPNKQELYDQANADCRNRLK
jgi:hypothetical protein